jgi:pimeloyl-ACP methyl ester carboxylesterase
MPTATVDNRKISMDFRGEGTDRILLIHGVASGSSVWNLVTQSLPDNCRAIAIDLPGFGGSERGDFSGNIEDAATVVHKALHSIGQTEPLFLLGHGYGGLVCLSLASRFPSHVNRLALVSTAGFEPDPTALLSRLASLEQDGWDKDKATDWIREGLAELPADDHLDSLCEEMARVDQDLIASCLRHQATKVFLETADSIGSPTLLIRGSEDTAVGPTDIHVLKARLKNVETVTIDGVGQQPALEAPDELRIEISRFFNLQ